MNQIGRKVYYDKATGNAILTTSEMMGLVQETTFEQDVASYSVLSERTPGSFDVVKLAHGAYNLEFSTSTGHRVNPVTKEIEFLYGENIEDLEGFKDMKIQNLKRICEETIEKGFTSKINNHVYRTNRDDQSNMIAQKEELNSDSSITEVYWKTEDVGYIKHTRADWIAIYREGFAHKKEQLFRYDTLKGRVKAALSKDDVNAINWNTIR